MGSERTAVSYSIPNRYIFCKMLKIIAQFIKDAEAGRIVRLSDVTEAFRADPGAVPVSFVLTAFDGREKRFSYRVPRWADEPERAFVLEYMLDVIGNLLSALGGRGLTIFVPGNEPEVKALFTEAEAILRAGGGHARPIKVIDRINRGLGLPPFTVAVTEEEAPEAPGSVREKGPAEGSLAVRLQRTAALAGTGVRVGIDVGGTDIKAVVYKDGVLVAAKEFDWNPGISPDAEGLIKPVETIARLLCCAAALEDDPREELRFTVSEALKKEAYPEQMDFAVQLIEAVRMPGAGLADSIGVSFPDVVLKDRICGGETPKTRGIREMRPERYEEEFHKLSRLNERLAQCLKPGGTVRVANDGNIAAYTAAVELAHGEDPSFVEKGVLAHSLGTDLGTGYLLPDGTLPFAPLECYDFRFDLGSRPQRAYLPEDLRSTRNPNSGLPGAQRYLGQSAVFRLLWERAPEKMREYTGGKAGYPAVRTEPEDLRKPLLAHVMALADKGDPDAETVFRQIGENLGGISREIDGIFRPQTETRLIFGRFVKSSRCFELIREGCKKTYPQLKLTGADESLANTALMRALAKKPELTVAQFGQAVGAAVFGAEGQR